MTRIRSIELESLIIRLLLVSQKMEITVEVYDAVGTFRVTAEFRSSADEYDCIFRNQNQNNSRRAEPCQPSDTQARQHSENHPLNTNFAGFQGEVRNFAASVLMRAISRFMRCLGHCRDFN